MNSRLKTRAVRRHHPRRMRLATAPPGRSSLAGAWPCAALRPTTSQNAGHRQASKDERSPGILQASGAISVGGGVPGTVTAASGMAAGAGSTGWATSATGAEVSVAGTAAAAIGAAASTTGVVTATGTTTSVAGSASAATGASGVVVLVAAPDFSSFFSALTGLGMGFLAVSIRPSANSKTAP